MSFIEFSKVIATSKFRSDLLEGVKDFDCFFEEAKSEIEYYDWCVEILESYIGLYFPGIVGVFLFKIKPVNVEIDEWLWIIVGDLPSTYITTEESPNAACALDSYIGAMSDWVEAALNDKPVENCVPVMVPATKENAKKLKSRLEFLDERILINFKHDLKS